MASTSKPSDSSSNGLLIASVVSIVAIVGLVILFKGGINGNLVAMEGDPGDFSSGLGNAYMRGTHIVSDSASCPAEEGYTGTAYYDFNDNFVGCADQSSFPQEGQQRYSGVMKNPKGYRAAEGGMYNDESTSSETFYRGQQGSAYRDGTQGDFLPTASNRGQLVG